MAVLFVTAPGSTPEEVADCAIPVGGETPREEDEEEEEEEEEDDEDESADEPPDRAVRPRVLPSKEEEDIAKKKFKIKSLG